MHVKTTLTNTESLHGTIFSNANYIFKISINWEKYNQTVYRACESQLDIKLPTLLPAFLLQSHSCLYST